MGEEEKQKILAEIKEAIELASQFTELPSVLTKIEDERGIRFAFTIEEKTGRLYCEYEPALTVAGLSEFFLKGKVRRKEYTFSPEEQEKMALAVIFCLNLILKQIHPMMMRSLDALFLLSVGILHREVIEQKNLRRIASRVSTLENVNKGLIKHVLDAFNKSTKQSFGLPTGHGGSRPKAARLKSPEELKKLVRVVDDLHKLWKKVTSLFEKFDYDAGSVGMVRASAEFKLLSKDYSVPDSLLKKVFKRKSSRQPELEPLSLAIEHARQLLDIKLKSNTVKARYLEAKKHAPMISKRVY